MTLPLMDLVAQDRAIRAEIDQAIQGVLDSGRYILGPNVAALEQEVAAYLGTRQAVGVASGTDALMLSLRALGIGPGDEVILPAYTFFATLEAVMMVGASPVLVDVRPDTYNLDVEAAARRLTPRSKAIIPVHLYGHPADMTPLLQLAEAHGLKVIEDNAQAFGAQVDGRKTGGLSHVGCLSFFPSKPLGGYGDGGMLVTDDQDLAAQVRMLRTHGWHKKYHPRTIGYNSRLDEIQAAILRVKLAHVDAWTERRRRVAQYYAKRLAGLEVGLPHQAPNARHVYHLFVVRLKQRDRVQQALTDAQIACAVYYPLPLHLLEACQPLGHQPGDFPVAEGASRETLALPLFPDMSQAQVDQVALAVERGLSAPASSR